MNELQQFNSTDIKRWFFVISLTCLMRAFSAFRAATSFVCISSRFIRQILINWLFIWITFNERIQEFSIYVEYFSCNDLTLCGIFSQEFLRLIHCNDDERWTMMMMMMMSLFWPEKKVDNQLENQITAIITATNGVSEGDTYQMGYMNQFQSNKWWFSVMVMVINLIDGWFWWLTVCSACHVCTAFPD